MRVAVMRAAMAHGVWDASTMQSSGEFCDRGFFSNDVDVVPCPPAHREPSDKPHTACFRMQSDVFNPKFEISVPEERHKEMLSREG